MASFPGWRQLLRTQAGLGTNAEFLFSGLRRRGSDPASGKYSSSKRRAGGGLASKGMGGITAILEGWVSPSSVTLIQEGDLQAQGKWNRAQIQARGGRRGPWGSQGQPSPPSHLCPDGSCRACPLTQEKEPGGRISVRQGRGNPTCRPASKLNTNFLFLRRNGGLSVKKTEYKERW